MQWRYLILMHWYLIRSTLRNFSEEMFSPAGIRRDRFCMIIVEANVAVSCKSIKPLLSQLKEYGTCLLMLLGRRLASVFDIFQMHLAADVMQSCSLVARELLLAKIANGFNSRCFHYELFLYRPGSCYYPIPRDLYRFVSGNNKNM